MGVMKPINPNSIAYFMGFNAFRTVRQRNPFNRNTQTKEANDWLRGFVDAQKEANVQQA